MRITTATNAHGLRTLDASDEMGVLALAVEYRRSDDTTVWHLAVVREPAGMTVKQPYSYPLLQSAEAAEAWVQYLGDLLTAAQRPQPRPVWCPNDTRETARAAAEHGTERGVEVIE